MIKLRPCPFCGGDAILRFVYTDKGTLISSVQCGECGAKIEKSILAGSYFIWEDITEAQESITALWNGYKQNKGGEKNG